MQVVCGSGILQMHIESLGNSVAIRCKFRHNEQWKSSQISAFPKDRVLLKLDVNVWMLMSMRWRLVNPNQLCLQNPISAGWGAACLWPALLGNYSHRLPSLSTWHLLQLSCAGRCTGTGGDLMVHALLWATEVSWSPAPPLFIKMSWIAF